VSRKLDGDVVAQGGGGGAQKREITTVTVVQKSKSTSKRRKGMEKEKKKLAVKRVKVAKEFDPPSDWRKTYDLMVEMRRERNAPVDSMGAESNDDPFHILIALMLSSQTKDQMVAETMDRLKTHGLTVENLCQTSAEDLNELIRRVGFHNNKTRYIKEACEIIANEFDGKVPDTAEGLLKLPGVGPKMAFIALSAAYGKHEGIGVDTHMHRMLNVLGWVETKTPEQTRLQLQSWLPKDLWPEVNIVMVGVGQMIQQPAERAKLINFLATWERVRFTQARELLITLGMKKKHFEDNNEA